MLDKPLALSTATANWVRDEKEGDWVITGDDGKDLWRFPKKAGVKTCLNAIKMGRKYELEAFNTGILYGKTVANKVTVPIIKKLSEDVEILKEMNERLSEKLEAYIIGEE